MEKKQSILEKVRSLKGKKGLDTIIIIIIIAAIAFIYFSSYGAPGGTEEPEPSDPITAQPETADVEQRLSEVLSSIQGAGKVEVMVTYESGTELVPAVNTQTQTDVEEQDNQNGNQTTKSENTSSELVTVQNDGNSEAVVLREDEPTVRGVVVIAQGANDVTVRMQLAQAVCTVLDVDQSNVEVFVMK